MTFCEVFGPIGLQGINVNLKKILIGNDERSADWLIRNGLCIITIYSDTIYPT